MRAVLLEEAYRKIPVGRPICRWEFAMNTRLEVIHCFALVCILVPQNRVRWRLFMRTKGAFSFHRMFVSLPL